MKLQRDDLVDVPACGRAFLRPRRTSEGRQRVMVLAVVDVPEGTFEDGEDYACNVDSLGGLLRIENITEHVPRGFDAQKILTSGIKALWRRDAP